MKVAILAALVASASAFAPTTTQQSQQSSSSVLSAAFDKEIGSQAPLGFFDPLGVLADGDQAKFDRLRYVEIKHGRIAMMAVVGYLTTIAGIRFPGDISYSGLKFADIPAGFKALEAVPLGGMAQIIGFIFWAECIFMKDVNGTGDFPGDFRNGAIDFGWDKLDEKTKTKKRAIELNQGRAAQMGILALMVHEQLGVSILPGNVLP
jgi:Chlorophyll A-B binding protein